MQGALKEVEDALDLERRFAGQVRTYGTAMREAEKSSSYYVERYRRGLDTMQVLLAAPVRLLIVPFRLGTFESRQNPDGQEDG